MVVIGIDFGTDGSRIACLQKVKLPGTEQYQNQNNVLLNESSDRTTPSVVTYQEGKCLLGEAAKAASTMHAKNTIMGFKMLMGKDSVSDAFKQGQDFCPSKLTYNDEGEICAKITAGGEEKLISMQNACSNYFSKLKEVATFALEGKRDPFSQMDAVISVPSFFDQKQRLAVIEAAQVAGISPFTVASDIAALAMTYGFPQLNLPANDSTTKPLTAVFVLVGKAYSTAAVLKFKRDHFHVVSHASTTEFSGRLIDLKIAQHFANIMEQKFYMEPGSIMRNPRWKMRMLQAAEHTKKTLSGISKARFTVENVNDADFNQEFTREQLQELVNNLQTNYTSCGQSDKLRHPLIAICEDALASSGVSKEAISVVEVTGGASRMPIIKTIVEKAFGHPLSFTLHAEEAIAKGCMLIATRLSPRIKSREIHVYDSIPYRVSVAWVKEGEDDNLTQYLSYTKSLDDATPFAPSVSPRFTKIFERFTEYDVTDNKDEKGVNVSFKRTRPMTVSLVYSDEARNFRVSLPFESSIPASSAQPGLLQRFVPLCTLKVNALIPLPSRDALPLLKPEQLEVVQTIAKQNAPATPAADPNFMGYCSNSATVTPSLKFERLVKVRCCISCAGILSLESAFVEEDFIKEEKIPIKVPTPSPSPVASAPPADKAENKEEKKEEKKEDAEAAAAPNDAAEKPKEEEKKEGEEKKEEAKEAPKAEAEPAPAPAPAPTPAPSPEPQYEIKKTKKSRKIPLQSVKYYPLQTPQDKMKKALDTHILELNARKRDRERGEAKNALESYIYDMLRRADPANGSSADLAEFLSEQQRAAFLAELNKQNDWINYEEEADTCEKEEFVKRMKALQEVSNKAVTKQQELANRKKTIDVLLEQCSSLTKQCTLPEKAHIPEEERKKVSDEIAAFTADIQAKYDAQSKLPHDADLLYTNQELINAFHSKHHEWNKVLSKPKPEPKPEPKKAEAQPADVSSAPGAAGAAAATESAASQSASTDTTAADTAADATASAPAANPAASGESSPLDDISMDGATPTPHQAE